MRLMAAMVVAGLTVGFSWWAYRKISSRSLLSTLRATLLLLFGAAGAALALSLEAWVLNAAGLSLAASEQGALAAALTMLLLCAPVEEGAKLVAAQALLPRGKQLPARVTATAALLVGAGFFSLEAVSVFVTGTGSWLDLLRQILAAPAHLFFAGTWGYTLSAGRRSQLLTTWLFCVLSHGFYDHVVFGRGAGMLVVAVPMVFAMAFGVFVLVRQRKLSDASPASWLLAPDTVWSSYQGAGHRRRPLMLHWIFMGVFVNLGATLLFLGAGVYLGHRWQVDFALAQEAGTESILPMAILGGSMLFAFFASAFLIARASGTRSVLEPAWATGAAILAVLLLFSVTEPTALIVAAGVAPVGFILACLGAWLGMVRR